MNIETTWTDDDWNKFSSWIDNVLKTTPKVNITFNKKDGTKRVMKCTLLPELLPVVELKEGAKPRKESTTSIRVYDLEKKEWRSFTTKSVTNVSFNL